MKEHQLQFVPQYHQLTDSLSGLPMDFVINCICLPIERIWVGLPMSWEGHELRFDPCRRVQILIDVSQLPDSIDWKPVFTSKCWYPRYDYQAWLCTRLWAHLRLPPKVSCKDINPRPDYLETKLYMADFFLLDLWGYVHGFGYHPEGLLVPRRYYNSLKLVW